MTQSTKVDANNSTIHSQFHNRGLVAIGDGKLLSGQPYVAHFVRIATADTLFELLATLGHVW
jgi:hypothetical protein